MASVRVYSGATLGLEGFPVEVEVDSTPGLHFFNIVGLPDKTVDESKDRIGAAIRNSGFIAPKQKNQRIIVNLAPADIKKEGSGYDVPIALGYLLATKQVLFNPSERIFFGELSLDGSIRKLTGVLPLVIMAKSQGFKEIILPMANTGEASIIDGIKIFGVSSLNELIAYLAGKIKLKNTEHLDYNKYVESKESEIDFEMSHVKGQENAKRALLIAACGGHNILMHGPPGSGKTLLAKALAGIMPPMSHSEAIEVTKIYSISGNTGSDPIITQRPFRSPHHTTSAVAIVGGGSWPKPGEISLAHRGVLFLDEFPEFPRSVIEALRQPMEQGSVIVSRASSSATFPARFILVAAMNPCPCGNYGDEQKSCTCSAGIIQRYQKKISGPILDRIDIQIPVSRERYDKLSSKTSSGPSPKEMISTITYARGIQSKRFAGTKFITNSDMGPKEIQKYCILTSDAEQLVKKIVTAHNLSGRGYHKILKLSRTIADIDSSNEIQAHHVAEATSYRIQVANI